MSRAAVVVAVAAVLVVAALVASGLAWRSRDQTICRAINRQNATTRSQLERARVTLPTLAYYKQHPDELAQQLVEVERAIQNYAPIPC